MADTLIHVHGLDQLQALLDTLPAKIEKNIMRGAMRAGMNVVKDQAKMNCPVAPPSGKNYRLYCGYAGALRDSIRVGSRSRGGKVTAYVRAGGKAKGTLADTYYAMMVEYKTAAHEIKSKPGHALAFGGGLVTSVEHPGTAAHPFMRPALDSKAQDAVVATGEYIKKRLATKEGLDTTYIMLEGDEP